MSFIKLQNLSKKLLTLLLLFSFTYISLFPNTTSATVIPVATPIPPIPVLVTGDTNLDTKDGNLFEQLIALGLGLNPGSTDSITWHLINVQIISEALKIIIDINQGREVIGLSGIIGGNSLIDSGDWQAVARYEADSYFVSEINFLADNSGNLGDNNSAFVGFEDLIKKETLNLAQGSQKNPAAELICPIGEAELKAYYDAKDNDFDINTMFKIMENPNCNYYGVSSKLARIQQNLSSEALKNAEIEVTSGGGVRKRSECLQLITDIVDVNARLSIRSPYGNLCLENANIEPAGTVKDSLSSSKDSLQLQDRSTQADEIGENKGLFSTFYQEVFQAVLKNSLSGINNNLLNQTSFSETANYLKEKSSALENPKTDNSNTSSSTSESSTPPDQPFS